jgi:hypothetical protein
MEPDVIVQTVDQAVDYDPSEATDQGFMVGFTEKGPTTPVRTFSLLQWEGVYGGPVENSILHKEAMLFFHEAGPGAALVTIRRVGPAPVHASSTAKNAVPANVIKLEANDVGAWGNALTRQFVAGIVSGVQLIIVRSGTVLFHSGDLTTQAAIVAYCAATGVVTATAEAGVGLPVVDGAPVAFAGGTDDAVHSVDAQRKAALDALDARMGPGQVFTPGDTTEVAHDQLREHHIAFDRIALFDEADSGVAGTITGGILPQRVKEGADGTAGFAPWIITPDGTQLAPSAFAAAKIAKMDLATGNPNLPAAGVNGAGDWITGLTHDFTAADRSTLDAGGVNAIYNTDGVGNIQIYDYDTVADPTLFPLTTALSNARLDMLLRWKARAIGRTLILQEIDALGHLASKYAGMLDGMLKPFKGDGTIYDFVVDTNSVNSRATAAEKRLNARIKVQRTQYSKWVSLEVTNHAITETI